MATKGNKNVQTTTTTQAPVNEAAEKEVVNTGLEAMAESVTTDLGKSLINESVDPETKDNVLNIAADASVVEKLAAEASALMVGAKEAEEWKPSKNVTADTEEKAVVETPAVPDTKTTIDTSKDGLQLGVFENRIAFVKDNGTSEEKYVVGVLENYVNVCSTSIDKNKLGVEQQRLWRLFEYIHNKPQQFKNLYQILIDFGRQYKESVFEIAKFYRAQEALTLSRDQLEAYNNLRQLLLETISTKNRTDVKRLIDIRKIVQHDCIPEHVRGFYVAYFEA